MKIAILSDIHGNDKALGAVLKEVSDCGAEKLFLLGDYVGYYYHPDKVIQMLSGWDTTMIQGNHERMLFEAIQDPKRAEEIRTKYGSGIEVAKKKLSNGQIEKFKSLPASLHRFEDGISIGLFHGSAWDADFYIYPDSKEETKIKCLESGDDFVFIGHTHYPFIFNNNNCTLVNVGSVGQPRRGGMASWALLDCSNKEVEIRATEFEVNDLIKEASEVDPQITYLSEVLLRR